MNKKIYLIIVGIAAAAVLLTILFYTILGNHRPVITSLAVEPETVLTRGSCQIVCNATDPDGDELSYGWSADGGGITGEGDAATWTAPNSAGSYNVTVIVIDSRGGAVTDHVTITVRINRSPIIASLEASAPWTTPSGSIQVTCDASDPDGDELSYEWTATGGNISGTGAVVNWTAPQEVGIYNVTAVVKDVYGREDTMFVSLSVATGTPPTIEELVLTAKEPKYLKKIGAEYIVGKTKQYDIQCIVSDTSIELVYEWSCQDGEISGEGSMIAWTAPDESLASTIVAVTVSDTAGNKVSKSIVFQVASCTSCTFG